MIVFILLLFLSSLRLRIHAGLNVLKVTVASRKHPLLAVISLAMAAEKWTRAPSRGRPLEDTRVPRPLSFVSPENYSRCFERKGRKRRSSSPSSKEGRGRERGGARKCRRKCSFVFAPSLREEPSWTRSTGHKIHDPFRAPPPPTRLGNGHEGWISFRLLLNLPGHKTRGGVAPRGYVLSARESWRRQRERERDYFICARARLPPETLWRRVFPLASFDSPRPLSGERRRYISRVGVYAGFLVARLSGAPGITLIPSLTVFCRGGILALGVGELSRLLTGASENVLKNEIHPPLLTLLLDD